MNTPREIVSIDSESNEKSYINEFRKKNPNRV